MKSMDALMDFFDRFPASSNLKISTEKSEIIFASVPQRTAASNSLEKKYAKVVSCLLNISEFRSILLNFQNLIAISHFHLSNYILCIIIVGFSPPTESLLSLPFCYSFPFLSKHFHYSIKHTENTRV